jgi:dienelactone hydrolase
LASREGIILLAPDLESQGPDFFIALIDAVRASAAVNPRRVYLFGNSAGGRTALLLSLIDSEYYAATAVQAGSFRNDYRQAPQFIERANRKIPIAMWNGTSDQRVPLADARAARDLLAKFEFPVELHEMLGWEHDYFKHSDQVNAAAWAFLRQHQLEQDPTSRPYKP